MKKLSIMLLAIVLLLALTTTALAANTDRSETLTYRQITVRVNGQVLVPADANGKAVEPFIMQGSTYLPLRATAGALGLSAHWDAKTCTVELTSGADPDFGWGTPLGSKATKQATLAYRNIKVVLDGNTLTLKDVNGKAIEPFIIDGVSYLPLRAIAEALGVEVHWNGSTNEVLMTRASHRRADNDKKDEGLMIALFGGEEEAVNPLCFTANQDNCTVKLEKHNTPDDISLMSSTDGEKWNPYTIGADITLANAGDTVYFQAGGNGQNTSFSPPSFNFNYYNFALTGKLSVSGNIMSLVDASLAQTSVGPYMFNHLFNKCTALTDASDLVLPATTLDQYCYYSMFYGCTALETAPALPATTLAECCYQYMFEGCEKLTTAPALPATELKDSCYERMFYGCSSLNYIEVGFTSWVGGTNPTNTWLSGVAANGTFTCPAALDTNTKDSSHVPSGWTVVNP